MKSWDGRVRWGSVKYLNRLRVGKIILIRYYFADIIYKFCWIRCYLRPRSWEHQGRCWSRDKLWTFSTRPLTIDSKPIWILELSDQFRAQRSSNVFCLVKISVWVNMLSERFWESEERMSGSKLWMIWNNFWAEWWSHQRQWEKRIYPILPAGQRESRARDKYEISKWIFYPYW